MIREIHGQLEVDGEKFAIVVSRFNDFITSKLLTGAIDELKRHGTTEDAILTVYVPGSFEIPLTAMKLAESEDYNAVICLGCILRGQTPHFEYLASEVVKGIAQASWGAEIPIAFGVITADTVEQAVDRAGLKAGNKGAEAARSAIEMISVLKQL